MKVILNLNFIFVNLRQINVFIFVHNFVYEFISSKQKLFFLEKLTSITTFKYELNYRPNYYRDYEKYVDSIHVVLQNYQ